MMTAEEKLRRMFPLAKGMTLKRMVREGRVLADGKAVKRLSDELPDELALEIMAAEDRAEQDRIAREQIVERRRHLPVNELGLDIVFEDADLLIVNKPPGLLTSTVPTEKRPTLLQKVTDYLMLTDQEARVGLIHRLDKDARGLLVFTKCAQAYYSMKGQLKARNMGREYHAIVWGCPSPREGTVKSRLVDGPDGVVFNARGTGEPAVTHYKVLKADRETSLVKVKLETGRKHQIRVHLAKNLNCPIVGDRVYGPGDRSEHLLLAATRIEFLHPRTGETGVFETDIPEDFVTR
jgi:23S rRNA pseudouridine1911/1915/1917 synthase